MTVPVVFPTKSRSRRRAKDQAMTVVVAAAFCIAALPLVSLAWTAISRGLTRWDVEFFTWSMRGVMGPGGGVIHAVLGTVLITAAAAILSVPLGVMTAIYLVEYGSGGFARTIRFLVDVMTGIPSIVAGLATYALFALLLGPGVRFGIGGSVALTIIMTPVVIRSAEEMLALVPADLREACYALGVPKYRCITKVVLPTALSGIVSGVVLGISRIIGETAPLLLVAGAADAINTNLFQGRMASLPVYIYDQWVNKGTDAAANDARAWAAALLLIVLVVVLHLAARGIVRIFRKTAP